jgi:hypothetical protein
MFQRSFIAYHDANLREQDGLMLLMTKMNSSLQTARIIHKKVTHFLHELGHATWKARDNIRPEGAHYKPGMF